MKIATVTLNPAIDQTVRVDHFRPNTVNRGLGMQFDAGGKGVNVASFLVDAGYSVVATGFLGQDNDNIFKRFFARKGIKDRFVYIPGSTRIGIKIVDEAQQQTTDINQYGLAPSGDAMHALLQVIDELAASYDWFALSGALPPGVPSSTYAAIITKLKERGKKVSLDTSGEALQQGVLAGATIVKPNIDELQQLVDASLSSEDEIEQAAHRLLNYGTQIVVVSMGKQGAMFIDAQETLVATPPAISVKSTVGAGDAMIAGLIVGQILELELSECARLATAFSLEAISHVGAYLSSPEVLREHSQLVSIRPLTPSSRSLYP
ncbi:MAG TPA: 1-phosphofructokinase [Ktedonobacteraceae bacterium]|nr:1-phosphofructokinase [Ktedonobacteraceae bacterium]